MKLKLKKNLTVVVLVAAIVLMLLGSIVAQAVNTSGYSVDVSRVYFTLSAALCPACCICPRAQAQQIPVPPSLLLMAI